MPISAMVVGFNEAHLLKNCLESVSFCDEIFYTDLGSSDESLKVAESFGAKILYRDRENIPSCEMVQAEVINLVKHEWVIFIDPDEEVDESLWKEIERDFTNLTSNPKVGGILVPWVFYFKKHRLKGTIWGGDNKKFLLVNKHRFDFLPIIHYGRKLKNGYESYSIELNEKKINVLHHYWLNSYKVFFSKHIRYLKNEAEDRYNLGIRIRLKKIFTGFFISFWNSFYTKKGYKDGVLGFLLSLFWGLYEYSIILKMSWKQFRVKAFT